MSTLLTSLFYFFLPLNGQYFSISFIYLVGLFFENWIFESNNLVTLEISFFLVPRVFCFNCCRPSLCQRSVWGVNLQSSHIFSEPMPSSKCAQWLSNFHYIWSCFWMSYSFVTVHKKGKRKNGRRKRMSLGPLNRLEVTSAGEGRDLQQWREVKQ